MNKYQTIFLRFIALIIDCILLIPLWFFGLDVSSGFVKNGLSQELSIFTVSILFWLFFNSYYILMHAFFGQTIGKLLTGVKVVSSAEMKINLGQSMVRSLPHIIPIIILLGFNSRHLLTGETNQKDIQVANAVASLLNIGVLIWTVLNIIVALSDDKHRALHDYFAGTIVVKPK